MVGDLVMFYSSDQFRQLALAHPGLQSVRSKVASHGRRYHSGFVKELFLIDFCLKFSKPNHALKTRKLSQQVNRTASLLRLSTDTEEQP